jgi:hypothetical protein
VKADFTEHVECHHDTRFVSVYGFSIATAFPGVNSTPETRRLIRQHGERQIHGTSDIVTSDKYRRLLQKANEYAKEYNTMLLHYLRSQKAKP